MFLAIQSRNWGRKCGIGCGEGYHSPSKPNGYSAYSIQKKGHAEHKKCLTALLMSAREIPNESRSTYELNPPLPGVALNIEISNIENDPSILVGGHQERQHHLARRKPRVRFKRDARKGSACSLVDESPVAHPAVLINTVLHQLYEMLHFSRVQNGVGFYYKARGMLVRFGRSVYMGRYFY